MNPMEPGVELDSLVQEMIMGGREELLAAKDMWEYKVARSCIRFPPAYSVDMSCAMDVLEKLPRYIQLIRSPYTGGPDAERWQVIWGSYTADEWVQAETLPHAICLAALKLNGVSHPIQPMPEPEK